MTLVLSVIVHIHVILWLLFSLFVAGGLLAEFELVKLIGTDQIIVDFSNLVQFFGVGSCLIKSLYFVEAINLRLSLII